MTLLEFIELISKTNSYLPNSSSIEQAKERTFLALKKQEHYKVELFNEKEHKISDALPETIKELLKMYSKIETKFGPGMDIGIDFISESTLIKGGIIIGISGGGHEEVTIFGRNEIIVIDNTSPIEGVYKYKTIYHYILWNDAILFGEY